MTDHGAIFDEHVRAEFELKDADAAELPVLGAEQAHALEKETATNVLIARAKGS